MSIDLLVTYKFYVLQIGLHCQRYLKCTIQILSHFCIIFYIYTFIGYNVLLETTMLFGADVAYLRILKVSIYVSSP